MNNSIIGIKFTNFLNEKANNYQMNIGMNKSNFEGVLKRYFLAIVLLFSSVFMYAQNCNPRVKMRDGNLGVSDTFCVGELVEFQANSPGFTTNPTWDFGNPEGGSSVDQNPTYGFQSAGTFTVTYTGNGGGNTCSGTVLVVIKPSPEIGVELLSPDEQCFKDNKFCFLDTTRAPGGNIIRQTALFSDGQRYDTFFTDGVTRQQLAWNFCHTITDPSGGFFDLTIESEDASGCISRVTFENIIYVHPRIGAEFNNITPKPNPGCDSTLGVFKNISLVPLADIDTFFWDWGDGTTIGGSSTNNTEWWEGENGDNVVEHMYRTHGSFDGSLIVSAYGCTDVFTWKAAVANIVMEPKILSSPNPACTPDNPIEFSVANLPSTPGVSSFLWNFGDPPAGPLNINDKTLVPTKGYGPGVWMISLRLIAGPCDVTIYDTVQLVGPGSTIEVAFDRVDEDETYQCVIEDSIHFPNNSSYYQNDYNRLDEDSFVYYYDYSFDFQYDNTTGLYSFHYREWEEKPRGNFATKDDVYSTTDTITEQGWKVYFDTVKDSLAAVKGGDTTWHRTPFGTLAAFNFRFGVNPRLRWVFNYTPPVGKGGTGNGDQTAIDPAVIERGYNPNVWRVWEMGDRYAPQCTTDSRPWVNKNVGINCNWTVDSVPVHWYTPWDEIYQTFQDGRNYTTPTLETRLFKGNGSNIDPECYQVAVYPSNPMIVPGDTVLTIPLDSTYTYRGVTIPAGVTYPKNRLGNWIVKRPPSIFIGTELYWDAALDTFVAVNNLTDTTYHNEDWLGRNNITAGNAKTTWTPTYHDMDIFVPAGVTIKTLKLPAPGGGGNNVGRVRTFTGPQVVTLEAEEQFEVVSKDSVITVIKIEENPSDTTYAQPSNYIVMEEVFGIPARVVKSAIFVDSAAHRNKWFLDNAQCFNVTLWQQDTIHPLMCESEGTKSLALIPPNAKGMKWVAGIPCPFDGVKLDYILTFDITETKPGCTQRWFAVNLDSLAGPTNFVPFDGGLLAPPPPGLPIPFVFPYDLRGNLGGQFVKGYTPSEIGNDPALRNPSGSFTLGLIVGNGKMVPTPPGSTTMLPECLDTFWYTDFFRILYLNAGFQILDPTTPKKVICAGEDAYFRINEPIQDSISVLRWDWGYQGIGRGPLLDVYVEQFKYYQEYEGPVAGRNDENVSWNSSDKWLYNYVIRQKITDFGGYETIDTIVATIVKDWKVVAEKRNAAKAIERAFDQVLGLDYQDIPADEIPLYLGDGTFGCLDTTGLSQFFTFSSRAYSEKVDPDVWVDGNKRMRCRTYSPATIPVTTYGLDPLTGDTLASISNPSQDSIVSITNIPNYDRDDCIEAYEASLIVHFRDSSLQGYDTLLQDTSGNGQLDTIAGVWKHSYVYPELTVPDLCNPQDKDTVLRAANGPMVPTLFLNNTVGCEARAAGLLNVGFYNEYWIDNANLCEELPLFVEDSLRYYQYGEEDPFTYPIKEIPFWQDPIRYSNNIEYHKVDWGEYEKDSFERSIVLNHVYKAPGKYDITIVAKDSMGCRDTSRLTAFVSRVHPEFTLPAYDIDCEAIVDFTDSSWVDDPCLDTCANGNILSCEKIIAWQWDFGDGTRKSLLQNPSHEFTSGGYFDVTLTVWTELGCVDSITHTIYIPGPQPEFRFALDGIKDTAIICVNDSVFLKNLSKGDGNQPKFSADWGDGDVSTPTDSTYGHAYLTPGVYELYLSQEVIMPDGNRCQRVFPDTSESLLQITKKIVIVRPRPEVHISASDTVICPDEQVIFNIDSIDDRYIRLKWIVENVPSGDTINEKSNVTSTTYPKFSVPGTYLVIQAPEYDELPRCWDRDTMSITVESVEAKFSIDSTNRPEFCFKNESINADPTKYQWTFEDNPSDGSSIEVDPCYDWDIRKGTYEVCLIAQNAIGCLDTFCLDVNNSLVRILVPYNVFTPNNDGQNDLFVIDGESLEEYNIKIFNRWGEKVFETNDINVSWNGKVDNTKADCPESTYFYIINYKFLRGEENDGDGPIEGQVELIRN